MTDPERWSEESADATSLERELVLAGQEVRMPASQKQVIWSSIVQRGPTITGSSAAQGGAQLAEAPATGSAWAPALKALLLLAAAGGGVGAALSAWHDRAVPQIPEATSTTIGSAHAPSVAESRSELRARHVQTALEGTSLENVPPAMRDQPKPVPSSGLDQAALRNEPETVPDARGGAPASRNEQAAAPPAADSTSLPSELREESLALLKARSALRAGDTSKALGLLEQARLRFPRGALGQEREALTIEVLAESGDRAAAKQRAETFLRAHPRSPHAADVRSIAEH